VSCATMVRNGQQRVVQHQVAPILQKQGWKAVEPAEALPKASSVLVVRHMGLGDVLMTTPLLRELKLQLGVEVCFATLGRYVPVLWRNPWVDSVVALGTHYHPERFDVAIDLNWYAELSKDADRVPRQEIFAKAAGITLADTRPVYRVAPEEADWARGRLAEMRRPLVGVQVRASSSLRSYPRSKLVRMVELLVRAGLGVVIVDETPSGRWPCGALDLSGELSIRAASAVIKEVDVLVTPDSGLMHVAAAVGTPCVALFGPTDPRLRVRGYAKCVPLQGSVRAGCVPCHDQPRCKAKGCPRCLSSISPREIVEAVQTATNSIAPDGGGSPRPLSRTAEAGGERLEAGDGHDRLTPGPSPAT